MKSLLKLFLTVWVLLTVAACVTGTSQPGTASPLPMSPSSGGTTPGGANKPASPVPTSLPTRSPTASGAVKPASPLPAGSSVRGVFEGITPCSPLTRPLPQIPADTHCEQMIWYFALYQDPATGTPTTYTLKSAYGVPLQGTPGLVGGGTPIEMEGSWAIVKGARIDPDAVVYRLNSDQPTAAVSFLRMSEDLLHVLNRDRTLMVGNAAWSYTLNRTDNRIPTPAAEPASPPPEGATRPAIPPKPEGASVLGVFEGRLPCHEIVLEWTKVAPYPGCAKIKMRLTLYQDQQTGAPGTYLFQGTTTIREGTWTIISSEGDPATTIYQLHLDNAQPPVSFLKADDNHLFLLDRALNFLVGDALFSYTLSRIEQDAP